jgi:hypothetical protein
MASTALYARTKRRRAGESIESFVLDPDDWRDYLEKQKLIRANNAARNYL